MRERYNIGTLENPVFQGLYERASMSVGGSIHAARLAAQGGIAYHPSGGTHHGMRDHASGFCFFNDPVFAHSHLPGSRGWSASSMSISMPIMATGSRRPLPASARVMTISVHEENRWPWTGGLGDRGTGNARNLPVPGEMNDSEMDYLMAAAVLPLARRFAPEAVVVTCGADALAGDPLSTLALSNTCLWDAVMALTALAPATVVLGGGGYNPWTVARCWTGLWGRIAGHAIPAMAAGGKPRAARRPRLRPCGRGRPRCRAGRRTLADPRNDGMIRERFREIAAAVLAPTAQTALAG